MENKFLNLAQQELDEALSKLPSDPTHKFVIFTETIRVISYWAVFQSLYPEDKRLSIPDFSLIRWGWNLAAEHLYSSVETPGAFPISESTNESRQLAASLLHKLGCSVLLKRASSMIKYGFLNVEVSGENINVKHAVNARHQFLDNIEFYKLESMEKDIKDKSIKHGWQYFNIDDYSEVENLPGNYFSSRSENSLDRHKMENIDELMLPLIHPWDSGHGIMIGYGALPEVDAHFLAEATELALECRAEAGIHPEAKIGDISGAELTVIITFLIALYKKHVRFCLLAIKKYPDISIQQSLTIWGPLKELEDSIVDYSNFDRRMIKKALDAVTMQPEEAAYLSGFTTTFAPLLLSLGNGVVLKPVFSILGNPFHSVAILQQWRNKNIINHISKPREEWMRKEIYSIFDGKRYMRVNGNIKIRYDKKVLTDIDAAIFDTLTGELALFQIKWQDFYSNDVKKLRSMASNLSNELDEWAEKVSFWINKAGKSEITKTLRLKLRKNMPISSIYLFGISRNKARVQGYGFNINSDNLAIANWPQFLRVRYKLGPADRVFHSLFETLRFKMNEKVNVNPLPMSIRVAEHLITFEDMWNTVE